MRKRSIRPSLALAAFTLAVALAPAPGLLEPLQADPLKELAEARVKVCEKMLDFYRESLKAPPAAGVQGAQERYAVSYEPIELWSRRLADARLDAAPDQASRIAILAAEVDRIKKFEGDIRQIAEGEPEWRVVADRVAFYRLDADYRLAREKAAH